MDTKQEKLAGLLKAAQGSPPTWTEEILSNPLVRGMVGFASPSGNDAAGPFGSGVDQARIATGRTVPERVHDAPPASEMATGPDTNNPGADYYRGGGRILGTLGGIAGVNSGAIAEPLAQLLQYALGIHPGAQSNESSIPLQKYYWTRQNHNLVGSPQEGK